MISRRLRPLRGYIEPLPSWNGFRGPAPLAPLRPLSPRPRHRPRRPGRPAVPGRARRAGAVRRADRHQLDARSREHHAGRTGGGATAPGGRISRQGRGDRGAASGAPEPGRPAPRHGRPPAHPAARASGRGGGPAGGLVARPVHADREGRLLLRPGHERHQGHGRDLRADHDRAQARPGAARPRRHPRPHGRRGGRATTTASSGCSPTGVRSSTRRT